MGEPYTCPVCGGNGLVSNGFYNQTSGSWSTTSCEPETCRTCSGGGIIGISVVKFNKIHSYEKQEDCKDCDGTGIKPNIILGELLMLRKLKNE